MHRIIKVKDVKQENEINQMSELEINLQHAIDDLISESEVESEKVSQHVSMIVAHLARAAATLRIKKQQEMLKTI